MGKNVLDFMFIHAAEHPEKLCVADKNKSASYSDVCDRIKRVGAYLHEQGVKKGDIVGLRSTQTVEFAAAFFGIQYIGAIVCPVEKTASAERTGKILNQISSRYILDVSKYDLADACVLDLSEAVAWNKTMEQRVAMSDEDISNIIFTTGTMGKSKGILISCKTDIAIAENVIDSVSMSSDEVELITSPTSHSLAIRRMYAAMYIGSSIVFTENFLLYNNFWGLIEKHQVTAITFVPAILNLIMEAYKDKLGQYDAQLHYIQLGSAPLHEDTKECLINMLPTTRLYNTYGATESGCTIILEFSKYGKKANCIGRTTVNTKLFFTDESRTTILKSVDEVSAGYMAFAGDMNMSGYVNDSAQTAEVLRDGIIYTNDIGYLGEDGLVYLLGRAGEVINSGGLKINPVEIEEIAGRMSGIRDCACVPVKDERRGEVPKLFVEFEPDITIENKIIKDFISQYLEDYKIPVKIEQIDKIPRTFNGKIIRKQLM